MRIIVAGASGFVGRNLLLSLPPDWHAVALYHKSNNFPAFVAKLHNNKVAALACDLSDPEEVRNLVREAGGSFDLGVYLAGNSDPAVSVQDPSTDARQNVVALVNFLTQVRIARLIYFSSGAVYDGISGQVSPAIPVTPRLPYALSKLAAEGYVRYFAEKAGTVGSYINLRFFGCYGPYEPNRKIYTRLVRSLALTREKKFAVRGNGRNLIDAMFVSDTISALHRIIQSDVSNLTLDFCTGTPISINELVHKAASIFGVKDLEIEHTESVPEYISFWASTESMERLFGFKPTIDLSEGLQCLAEHLRMEDASL